MLVIGFGNPLRGDDGLGHVAAQRLEDILRDSRVEIILAHQLMPEMSEPISRAGLVIFIDASASDPPGHVACTEIEPATNSSIRETHELGPSQLLGLARNLFGRCARGVLFSVGTNDFELREGLSPQAAAGVDEVVKRAGALAQDFPGATKDL